MKHPHDTRDWDQKDAGGCGTIGVIFLGFALVVTTICFF